MSYFSSGVSIWCYDRKKEQWYMSNYGWRGLLPWHKVPTADQGAIAALMTCESVFIDPDTHNPATIGQLMDKGLW